MKAKAKKLNTTPDGELACMYGEPWLGEHPICEQETKYSICVSEEEVIDLAAYLPSMTKDCVHTQSQAAGGDRPHE